jgi:predicted DCC family thiol-disulfide oxidoreductase YuxK
MSFFKQTLNWLADEPRHQIGVRILQTGIGLVILFRIFTEGPFASFLWGPHGIGDNASYEAFFGKTTGQLLALPFQTEIGTRAVLAALGLGACGLILGYRTRLSTAVVLVTFNLVLLRNIELGDGGDNVTQLVLIYMLFLIPVGTCVERSSLAVWLHNVAVMAIAAQLMILYETSGFMKATGEPWNSGIALYKISQVDTFSLPALRDLFKNPYVTTLASYSAMFLLIWFPIAMFSRFKLLWLAMGICFHIGIGAFMGLVTFSSVMISLELFFITDEEHARFRQMLRSLGPRLLAFFQAGPTACPEMILFIDGYCRYCRVTGRAIQRLAGEGRIRVSSFRHDDEFLHFGIEFTALIRRMHVVDLQTGEARRGFEAIRVLSKRIPLLWPVQPAFWFLGVLGQGERLYDALATRRWIVPDPRSCDGALLCRLPTGEPSADRPADVS